MRFVFLSVGVVLLASPVMAAPSHFSGETAAYQQQNLTLHDAVKIALEKSHLLQTQERAKAELEADVLQAGLRPNPEASLEISQFAGQNQYSGLKAAELTAGIGLPIEMGGKRAARLDAADKAIAVSSSERETIRLDVVQSVVSAYYAVLAMEAKVALAENQEELAKKALEVVRRRVNAAREPVVQQTKAEVAYANAKMAKADAQKQADGLKKQLFQLMGAPDIQVALMDDGRFEQLVPPQPLAVLEARLTETPEYQRFEKERARSKALLALEKTAAIPDPTVSIGITDYRESDEQALMLGVSLPIPVYNRNQGNIAKAGHAIGRIESEQRQALKTLKTDLLSAWQEMDAAYTQVQALQRDVLPQAQRAYTESRRGYETGNFSYLEVLDAQRTLADTRLQRINLMQTYHQARARVQRMTGEYATFID